MNRPLLLVPVLCLLVACMSGGADATKSRGRRDGEGYLEKGPAVSLDVTAETTGATALQLLEERAKEAAALKAQVEELEKASRAAELRAIEAEKVAKARIAEVEQLRGLLEKSMTEQRDLTSEVLKSRIARLKVEQEVLRLKLSDLVREEK